MSDKPRKKRIRKSKAERQTEIIEAAIELLPQYGLRGTTVSRIAGAVGISQGALYQHFANREAVILAALNHMRERFSHWTSSASGVDAYRHMLDLGARHGPFSLSALDTFVRPLLEIMISSGQGDQNEQVRERQLMTLHGFVELADKGKADGSIRADAESEDIAWALLTFAWSEDLARVVGLDQYISSGASVRNLRRVLAAVATDPLPVEPDLGVLGKPKD